MTKQALLPRIVALAAATTTAAAGVPETGLAEEGGGAATTTAGTASAVWTVSHPAGIAASTFEYRLEPFHHTNFDNRREFEEWLDDLGEDGWLSIAHFPDLDPSDHQRLFMREVGGPARVVDFEIVEYGPPLMAGVEDWVPEWDELGEEGKYPVWLYEQGGEAYAVTETYTLDGILQTLSWAAELAGTGGTVGKKKFKSAANKLAEEAHVPNAIGLSEDRSDTFVVGLAETTPERPNTVKLRFGKATISTSPKKWRRLVNKQAKKGYHLAAVELVDGSATKFLVVYAQVKVNGELRRRECVVEPLLTGDLDKTVEGLNARGAAGYEEILVTFAGAFDAFQFVLCRDE